MKKQLFCTQVIVYLLTISFSLVLLSCANQPSDKEIETAFKDLFNKNEVGKRDVVNLKVLEVGEYNSDKGWPVNIKFEYTMDTMAYSHSGGIKVNRFSEKRTVYIKKDDSNRWKASW